MRRQQYIPGATKNQMKTQLTHKRSVQKKREDNLISSSFNITLLLCSCVLHDKFGFGATRLERLMDEVSSLLDSYTQGYVSIGDLNTMMKQETGIEFVFPGNLDEENYKYK